MTAAMLVLPLMDVLAKLLGQVMSPVQVTLSRFLVQSVLALIAALLLANPGTLVPPRIDLHVARGLCLAGATLAFFTEPMILTALSTIFLGERVGWRRWSAVLVGFLGALFIIRPSWAAFGFYAALPLGAALLFAGYLLLTRRLSEDGSMLAAQFVTGISGTIVLGGLLLLGTMAGTTGMSASLPRGIEWSYLFGIGVISFIAHGLVVLAFQRAPASVLAPFNYLEIVSATALAYAVFGDFPGGSTWIGIALIAASGIYIAHREHRVARAGKRAAALRVPE